MALCCGFERRCYQSVLERWQVHLLQRLGETNGPQNQDYFYMQPLLNYTDVQLHIQFALGNPNLELIDLIS